MHRADINVSFDKTRYGSQGNYFYKVNKAAMEAAVQPLISDVDNVTPSQLEEAVTAYATENPSSIFRVKKAGYETVYLTGAWKSSDNPKPIEPPTGVTVNGGTGQKTAAFVAATPVLAEQGKETEITITDSDANFSGIAANGITPYANNGASAGDTSNITDVVANGTTITFNCSVNGALDGGENVTAFKIGAYYYSKK